MIGYDEPRREDGDENAWEDWAAHAPPCEGCGKEPATVAKDGDYLCARCDSLADELLEARRRA